MKNEKGIFGKLLAIAGAILIATGVFVFQGLSSADENETTGGDGSVGLTVNGEDPEDAENAEGSEDPENENTESNTNNNTLGNTENETGPAAEYTYKVEYFLASEFEKEEPVALTAQTYTGAETEYAFVIPEIEAEGVGDFLGWYKKDEEKLGEYYQAGDEIELNSEEPELQLVAKFAVLESYALRYNGNGGINVPGAQVCQSYYGKCDFILTTAVPTREGYEFVGWTVNGDESKIYAPGSVVRSVSVDEPLTMYAKWAEIKTYTLMYDINGGSGAPEVQACKSASGSCKFVITDVTPTRNKATFVGWRRGEETYTAGMEITVTESNTILLAEWNVMYTFTLTYTSESGTENLPDAQTCETAMGSCTFIVTDKEPVREGYKFLGWRFEDKEDMLAKSGDELVVAIDGALDLKVKAVWSKIYTILNSGEVFGAGERVILRSSANYGNFEKLVIDSVEVPVEYYMLSESETTSVVLSNAFSQSLSTGEHGFEIIWSDGEANGLISVNQNEDGTKRFVIVDGSGNTDGAGLMYRPKAGAVSKESSGVTADSATNNEESNFDAMRTLIIAAVGVFAVAYVGNRIYTHHKLGFIEEF